MRSWLGELYWGVCSDDPIRFANETHVLIIHLLCTQSYPFGKYGSGFVLLNMFVMAYGAMVAYLLIIKDTVPTVLGFEHGTHLLERNLIVIATSLMVMVPLSMQRDMASLSFTSALSVFADCILVVFIAMFAPVKESVAEQGGFLEVLKRDGIQSTLFIGLGILSTAMACQHSAFIVANSLENKTRRRWRIVTNQSIGISAVLCAILGVCGYLGFLGKTQGDVLNNFSLESAQADAARILLAFTMVSTSLFRGRAIYLISHSCCSKIVCDVSHGKLRRQTCAHNAGSQWRYGCSWWFYVGE